MFCDKKILKKNNFFYFFLDVLLHFFKSELSFSKLVIDVQIFVCMLHTLT